MTKQPDKIRLPGIFSSLWEMLGNDWEVRRFLRQREEAADADSRLRPEEAVSATAVGGSAAPVRRQDPT